MFSKERRKKFLLIGGLILTGVVIVSSLIVPLIGASVGLSAIIGFTAAVGSGFTLAGLNKFITKNFNKHIRGKSSHLKNAKHSPEWGDAQKQNKKETKQKVNSDSLNKSNSREDQYSSSNNLPSSDANTNSAHPRNKSEKTKVVRPNKLAIQMYQGSDGSKKSLIKKANQNKANNYLNNEWAQNTEKSFEGQKTSNPSTGEQFNEEKTSHTQKPKEIKGRWTEKDQTTAKTNLTSK